MRVFEVQPGVLVKEPEEKEIGFTAKGATANHNTISERDSSLCFGIERLLRTLRLHLLVTLRDRKQPRVNRLCRD